MWLLVTTLVDRMIRHPDEQLAPVRVLGELVLAGLFFVAFDRFSLRYGNFRVALGFGAAFLVMMAWLLRFELFGIERSDED